MGKIKLFIDTSSKNLAIGISKENKIIYNKQFEAPKKHSELAAYQIKKALKKTRLKIDRIDQIVVCNGPGSYTGIRVGLTLGKIITKTLDKELMLLDKASIIAVKEDYALVVLDAKGNNAYYGFFKKGKMISSLDKDSIENIKKIKKNAKVLGDSFLLGEKKEDINIVENMFLASKQSKKESSIDNSSAIYIDKKVGVIK